jgi:hypothetical protein
MTNVRFMWGGRESGVVTVTLWYRGSRSEEEAIGLVLPFKSEA